MNDSSTDAQQNLSLNALRDIFSRIDIACSAGKDERTIVVDLLLEYPEYGINYLRWLTRHAIHPEIEDDIMPDEVIRSEELITAEGFTVADVTFRSIPPTVFLWMLVQYRGTFWHVIDFDRPNMKARLKLLSDYE